MLSKDSRFFIKVLKEAPDLIKALPKDIVITFQQELELTIKFAIVDLTCFDYPNCIIENASIQKELIRKNPEAFLSMYDKENPNFNVHLDRDLAKSNFGDLIFIDFPNNIKHLVQFNNILDKECFQIEFNLFAI